MEKLYSSNELLHFMGTYGLPKSREWLYYNEKNRKIVCPRLPQGRKDRAFTQTQMEEIVKAFSPNGKGYWRYET